MVGLGTLAGLRFLRETLFRAVEEGIQAYDRSALQESFLDNLKDCQ